VSANSDKDLSEDAALDARLAAECLEEARKDGGLSADGLLAGLSGAEMRLFMDGYIKRARARMAGQPDPLPPDAAFVRLMIKHMKAKDAANGK